MMGARLSLRSAQSSSHDAHSQNNPFVLRVLLLILDLIKNRRILFVNNDLWSLISLETVSSSIFHFPLLPVSLPNGSPLPVGRSNLVPSSFLLQFWPILNKFPNCTFGPSCTILVVDDVVRLPQCIFSFCSQFTTAFVLVLTPQAVICIPFPSLTSPIFTAPIPTPKLSP